MKLKIPEYVTDDCIKMQISALKTLLKEYKTKTHDIQKCILCATGRTNRIYKYGECTSTCDFCPWIWFTGKNCDEYYMCKTGGKISIHGLNQMSFGVNVIPNKILIQNRKRQIKRWIAKLEEK